MVGHFASPSMQGMRVWGDNQEDPGTPSPRRSVTYVPGEFEDLAGSYVELRRLGTEIVTYEELNFLQGSSGEFLFPAISLFPPFLF